MPNARIAWIAAAFACASLLTATPPARAQAADYPSRPIRFIVPIGPGSSGDTMTRTFAEHFREVAGQPAVVENKPGADLTLGTQAALSAPADGYTVVLVSPSATVINPLFVKNLPYRPEDLLPVLNMTRHVAVLITSPDSRYKSLADVVAAARRDKGGVSLGTYGNTYRLGALDLGQRAGIAFNHVPYKGASQAVTDVVGGAVDLALMDIAGAAPLVNAGKVRALAVAGATRHPLLPEVATVQEAGYPGYTLYTFIGFAIHAKTPAPVARKLEEMMRKVMADPAVRAQLAQQSGGEVVGTGRKEFTQLIADEAVRYRELAKLVGDEIR
ncbi:tripartite tricarboxylate transporter substrate binding protein [Variovorax paradoxus]|jgi:tripartite-type tricarboxylate transporter receptor subunit TctC|uniref:tripartite tricarboxylate transporter substrate binding protein n=1 Tax=Variovorax TaxID=34072 RepID=UPI0019340861|nr:tripartite tricarboxylate transporter substrate binding protein [Variovorax paradoxus]